MDEFELPETKTSYTVQYKGASWIEGGEGQYDGLTEHEAQEEIAGMKEKFPQIEARYVKVTTTYELVVRV